MKSELASWASFDIGCEWATFGTPLSFVRELERLKRKLIAIEKMIVRFTVSGQLDMEGYLIYGTSLELERVNLRPCAMRLASQFSDFIAEYLLVREGSFSKRDAVTKQLLLSGMAGRLLEFVLELRDCVGGIIHSFSLSSQLPSHPAIAAAPQPTLGSGGGQLPRPTDPPPRAAPPS